MFADVLTALGQSRHFGRRPTTSGLPLETDVVTNGRHVSRVPQPDLTAVVQSIGDQRSSTTFEVASLAHQPATRVSDRAATAGAHTIFSAFPNVQFVDYTKNPRRLERPLPANYSVTFSRSETNEADAIKILERGHNVAVVFADSMPEAWNGYASLTATNTICATLIPKALWSD